MRLSPEVLIEAYRLGFFPMGESRESEEIVWVKPKLRGIFPLDAFHVPRSLRKTLRQDRFHVRIDQAFERVMELCGSVMAGREETWINDEIRVAYGMLHEQGHAHSVEAYDGEILVGGLYGVSIQGAFFGESMFSLRTDASKIALCHLVARLKAGGYRLLDTQFLTPHLARFGGIELPAAEYEDLLEHAMAGHGDFLALPDQISVSGSSILQSITQTS